MAVRKPCAFFPGIFSLLASLACALLNPWAARADGAIMPFGEIGRIAVSQEPSFTFETKNDSVGVLSKKDWDDLRSFGFYNGFSLRNWALELTADGLTNRARDDADRGRIDELRISATRRVFEMEDWPFALSLDAGAGAVLLGRLGMKNIQEIFHHSYRNFRPVPETYDTPEHPLTIVGEGIARVHRESDAVPLDLSTSIEIGHTGFFRTGSYVDATICDGFLGTDIFAGTEWASGYGSEGLTYANTLDSERGILLGANFRIGAVEAGCAYNVLTERNAAHLSVSLGGDGNKTKGEKTARKTGGIDAIELGAKPFLGAIRLRKRALTAGPFTASFTLGGDSEGFRPGRQSNFDTEIYKYEQAFAGMEAAAKVRPWLDVFAIAAGGVRKEQYRTRTVAESVLLDEKTGGMLVAEGGARFYIPDCRKRTAHGGAPGDSWGVSVAGGAAFADALVPGIYPYFQIRLFGETGRRP